ncbi:hypothetical protein BDZ89DRAFT_1066328 [Hymenopellis radicata]|nr:hypothetical protein BDZ89DRAFT_1066328 [Hymenopellis radicata]
MAATPQVLAIARKQLGLQPNEKDSKIPQAYLQELQTFLKLYPNDTNYRVIAEPNVGFGRIFCEETDCKIFISMDKNKRADDSKVDGIGSLGPYMKHIMRHSSHTKNRNARVAASQATPVKRELASTLQPSDSPLLAARRRVSTGTHLVKPEPTDSIIPRKRHSAAAFLVDIEASNDSQDTPSSPYKKLKREDSATRPFGTTHANSTIASTSDKVEDTRVRIGIHSGRTGKSAESRTTPISTANVSSPARCILSVVTVCEGRTVPPHDSQGRGRSRPSRIAWPTGIGGLAKPEPDDDDAMDVDPDVGQAAILNRVTGSYIPYVAPVANADSFDDNGDFHGRGRDTFQGPVARADDIEKFLMSAGNAEAFDKNVDLNTCLKKLGLSEITSLLPGMEVPLMPHQVIGVSWMLEKEADKVASGGILGDEMGLGKVVSAVTPHTVMLKNKSRDKTCKTNLILTPKALLGQWKLEIELKTNNGLKCLIYHGSGKVKRKADLLAYDVVLTTFHTMALEWPDFEAEQKRKEKARRKSGNSSDFVVSDSDDDGRKTTKKSRKDRGLLFQVDFYRIILDEGHNIRNKRNRMSRAVTELSAKYRWVLTGTPIINSLADVYGYFRFLKVRPWHDWTEFNIHIANLEKKNPSLAMTRLQAIFKACLMRRMKDTMLDGKRLIELPSKTIELVKLEFTKEERDIYKMVETASQATFNRYLRAGTVLKRRLLEPDVRDALIRARDAVGVNFVIKMKAQMKDAALKRIKAEKESTDAAAEIDECPICFDALTSATVTPCCHAFCKECLDAVFEAALATNDAEPQQYREHERPCPSCRSAISKDKLFERAIFEPTNAELFPKTDHCRKAKAKVVEDVDIVMDTEDEVEQALKEGEEDEDNSDMSDFIVDDDDDDDADYKDKGRSSRKATQSKPVNGSRRKPFVVLDSDEEEDEPEIKEVVFGKKKKEELTPEALQYRFLASTKMKHMMAHLLKLFEEKPDEKVLVISQWTSCLDLVSQYLVEKGVTHVKFQGDMSVSKREASVRCFMSRDKERVMLLSLKCGGVGLNLTRANNVISLDLGWSQAVEAQAFDRVHRLGQSRAVRVDRLVIRDTVEDRILALQERKQSLADGSLGEGSAKKIGRLSVKELANLFGLDARGRAM